MRLLVVSLLALGVAFAGSVSHTLEVSPRDVVLGETDAYTVLQLGLEGNGTVQSFTSEPGQPLLPIISGNVLIPAGADIEDITVTPLARTELGDFMLHPVQPMRPLSQFNSVPFVDPEPGAVPVRRGVPGRAAHPRARPGRRPGSASPGSCTARSSTGRRRAG